MWFTYAGEENTWIPLEVARVKEIQEMNKNNQKPEDLKDYSAIEEETEIPVKAFDYENVVGQDSLTRLDDKSKKKNNNNRNKARKRPEGGQNSNPNQAQAAPKQAVATDANAPRPNPNRNKNKNRRNNPNRKPEQE